MKAEDDKDSRGLDWSLHSSTSSSTPSTSTTRTTISTIRTTLPPRLLHSHWQTARTATRRMRLAIQMARTNAEAQRTLQQYPATTTATPILLGKNFSSSSTTTTTTSWSGRRPRNEKDHDDDHDNNHDNDDHDPTTMLLFSPSTSTTLMNPPNSNTAYYCCWTIDEALYALHSYPESDPTTTTMYTTASFHLSQEYDALLDAEHPYTQDEIERAQQWQQQLWPSMMSSKLSTSTATTFLQQEQEEPRDVFAQTVWQLLEQPEQRPLWTFIQQQEQEEEMDGRDRETENDHHSTNRHDNNHEENHNNEEEEEKKNDKEYYRPVHHVDGFATKVNNKKNNNSSTEKRVVTNDDTTIHHHTTATDEDEDDEDSLDFGDFQSADTFSMMSKLNNANDTVGNHNHNKNNNKKMTSPCCSPPLARMIVTTTTTNNNNHVNNNINNKTITTTTTGAMSFSSDDLDCELYHTPREQLPSQSQPSTSTTFRSSNQESGVAAVASTGAVVAAAAAALSEPNHCPSSEGQADGSPTRLSKRPTTTSKTTNTIKTSTQEQLQQTQTTMDAVLQTLDSTESLIAQADHILTATTTTTPTTMADGGRQQLHEDKNHHHKDDLVHLSTPQLVDLAQRCLEPSTSTSMICANDTDTLLPQAPSPRPPPILSSACWSSSISLQSTNDNHNTSSSSSGSSSQQQQQEQPQQEHNHSIASVVHASTTSMEAQSPSPQPKALSFSPRLLAPAVAALAKPSPLEPSLNRSNQNHKDDSNQQGCGGGQQEEEPFSPVSPHSTTAKGPMVVTAATPRVTAIPPTPPPPQQHVMDSPPKQQQQQQETTIQLSPPLTSNPSSAFNSPAPSAAAAPSSSATTWKQRTTDNHQMERDCAPCTQEESFFLIPSHVQPMHVDLLDKEESIQRRRRQGRQQSNLDGLPPPPTATTTTSTALEDIDSTRTTTRTLKASISLPSEELTTLEGRWIRRRQLAYQQQQQQLQQSAAAEKNVGVQEFEEPEKDSKDGTGNTNIQSDCVSAIAVPRDETVQILNSLPWEYLAGLEDKNNIDNDDNDGSGLIGGASTASCVGGEGIGSDAGSDQASPVSSSSATANLQSELDLWDEVMTDRLCKYDTRLETIQKEMVRRMDPVQMDQANELIHVWDTNLRVAQTYYERAVNSLSLAINRRVLNNNNNNSKDDEGNDEGNGDENQFEAKQEDEGIGLIGQSLLLDLWESKEDYTRLDNLLGQLRSMFDIEQEIIQRIDNFDAQQTSALEEYRNVRALADQVNQIASGPELSSMSCLSETRDRLAALADRFWNRLHQQLTNLVTRVCRRRLRPLSLTVVSRRTSVFSNNNYKMQALMLQTNSSSCNNDKNNKISSSSNGGTSNQTMERTKYQSLVKIQMDHNTDWTEYQRIIQAGLELENLAVVGDTAFASAWSQTILEALSYEAMRCLAVALLDPPERRPSSFDPDLVQLSMEIRDWGDTSKLRQTCHNLVTIRFHFEADQFYFPRVYQRLCEGLIK